MPVAAEQSLLVLTNGRFITLNRFLLYTFLYLLYTLIANYVVVASNEQSMYA